MNGQDGRPFYRAGSRPEYKQTADYEPPEELRESFEQYPAFHQLPEGRRRGRLLHFTGPRQAKTRLARIEKCQERILNGKGLWDCICGLSKRMPGAIGRIYLNLIGE